MNISLDIKTTGIRHELNDYFRRCLTTSDVLNHNKVLTVYSQDGILNVECVSNWRQLLQLSSDITCFGVWPGKMRSDWFTFTVAQLKQFIEEGGMI